MARLDEDEDDAHLYPGEVAEEKIGSADYDVWACQSCAHVLKVRFGKLWSRYSKCPKCQSRTKSSTTKTVLAATEYSQGKVRVTETCAHCDYRQETNKRTPKIHRTDTGSYSGSSSFSSGGSSSGFGGGSSSGGGASGSW